MCKKTANVRDELVAKVYVLDLELPNRTSSLMIIGEDLPAENTQIALVTYTNGVKRVGKVPTATATLPYLRCT